MSEKINFKLAAQEKELLEKLAAKEHRTVSGLLRHWILREAEKAGLIEEE